MADCPEKSTVVIGRFPSSAADRFDALRGDPGSALDAGQVHAVRLGRRLTLGIGAGRGTRSESSQRPIAQRPEPLEDVLAGWFGRQVASSCELEQLRRLPPPGLV